MNINERKIIAVELAEKLKAFSPIINLPGINSDLALSCFVEQLIDSIRRIGYVSTIKERTISEHCGDPGHVAFNPIKAAIFNQRQGNIDESYWLIFLFTHFGKHKTLGWNLLKNVYGKLGGNDYWSWTNICHDPFSFRQWLQNKENQVKENGKFGNHRKYVSINALGSNGTGAAILSYIDWVGPAKCHVTKINQVRENCSNDPRELFECLFKSINSVVQFGRTAKFDYLTMLGKTGILDIEPGSIFLNGATGPLSGVKLLFTGNMNSNINLSVLKDSLFHLEQYLDLYFGMQVLEDALCNWQKSPNSYLYYGG